MSDHTRDLDALDPPVNSDGGRLRERIPLPTPEDLHKIIEALPRTLDSDHAAMLEGSGISPEVIDARGYRSIRDKSVLESLGYQPWQARVPTLLVPLRSHEGKVIAVQIRPDRPRQDKNGKVVKYDTPMGAAHRIDFPTVLPFPAPGGNLWITEGVKKSDAIGSKGIYCLALPGVDSWSGSEAIQDLKCVDWRGRSVVIAFDSDVVTNPRVGKARDALAEFLKDRGAAVRYLDLQPSQFGQKQGIDDFFASGHTLEEIQFLISDPPGSAEKNESQWTKALVCSDRGIPRINAHNLSLILSNDPDIEGRIEYNEFSRNVTIDKCPCGVPERFRLAAQIERKYFDGAVGDDLLSRAIETIAKDHPFHPVRDWLGSLKWDGRSRIDALFSNFFGSDDSEYTRAVSRNVLIGAVARIYRPGCKLDTMPVIEGPQGEKKSSAIETLFGTSWYSVSKAALDSKDFDQSLLGCWALEFAEMDKFSRADVARIKLQLSTAVDRIRLPYRRDFESFPRTSVFFGSINENEYLRDPTGNRRFWPVRVGRIDLPALSHEREQLWAEAVQRYESGEPWWNVPEQAKDEQEARFQMDSWEEVIAPWLRNTLPKETTTTRILEECLAIERGRHRREEQMRVGAILKRLGWERVRCRTPEGLEWKYVPVPRHNVGTGGNEVGTLNTDAIVPTVPISFQDKDPPETVRHCNPLSKGGDVPSSTTLLKKVGTVGTGRNNSVPEPCSHFVPTSGVLGEVRTNDTDIWEVE